MGFEPTALCLGRTPVSLIVKAPASGTAGKLQGKRRLKASLQEFCAFKSKSTTGSASSGHDVRIDRLKAAVKQQLYELRLGRDVFLEQLFMDALIAPLA